MAGIRLTEAKRTLLQAIKHAGRATVPGLAEELDLTESAVRQHLAALADEGLVESTVNTPTGPGRPGATWSLTDAGNRLFPDAHGELTVQLVDAIRQALGQRGIDKVIDARQAKQLAHYRTVVGRAGSSLRARVNALAEQRKAEGYMAEVVRDRDGLLLIEHHCPICDAAKACAGFCRSELALFRDVLGDDVTVERVEHLLAGAPRCAYRIRPAASPRVRQSSPRTAVSST
jgi:predicted ArsR family transcriptional regulator